MPRTLSMLFISLWFAIVLLVVDVFSISRGPESYLFYDFLSLSSKFYLISINLFLNIFIVWCLVFLSQHQSRILRILGGIAFNSFFILYTVSWGLYHLSGRFLTTDGIRFFIHGPIQIVLHILQTTTYPIIFLCILCIVIPFILYPLFQKAMSMLSRNNRFKHSTIIVGSLCLMTLLCFLSLLQNQQLHHSKALSRILKNELSPQMTLIFNFLPAEKKAVVQDHYLELIFKKQISLENFAKQESPFLKQAPVIVILVESLRADILKNGDIMPNLFQLTNDSIFFPNAFTTSSHSDYADMAVLSSHFPLRTYKHHYYPKEIWYPRVMLYDILKKLGYETAVLSAQNENWANMRNYLDTDNLDLFFDATSQPKSSYLPKEDSVFWEWVQRHKTAGKLDDGIVIDKTLQWITRIKRKDFFAYINLQRSHFPYTWPDDYPARYLPYRIDFSAVLSKYPESKAAINDDPTQKKYTAIKDDPVMFINPFFHDTL